MCVSTPPPPPPPPTPRPRCPQEKYARTVIARIFYVLDHAGRRLIDLRALRRSNLLAAFHAVDVEEDINAVTEYFRCVRGGWWVGEVGGWVGV